jgi:hypothetical protein
MRNLPARIDRIWFVFPFLIFSAMLFWVPLPEKMYGGVPLVETVLIIVCSFGMWIGFGNKNILGKTTALIAFLLLWSFPAAHVWGTIASSNSVLLGMLPYLDAASYYTDALRLNQGFLFSSGRRPFFAALLASLLHISNGNIRLAIFFFIVVNAISVFLLAVVIKEQWGRTEAVMTALLMYLYYRRYAPSLLTEQLGIALGVLALASSIYAIRNKSLLWFAVSLFLFSFGLNTRAGAFFILPALVGFGVLHFLKEQGHMIRSFFVLAVAVLMPFVMAEFLNNQIVIPSSTPYSNFSTTLYGQSLGGEGWHRLYADHPELISVSEPEFSRRVYAYAFQNIQLNPQNLARAAAISWITYFSPDRQGMVGFVNLWPERVNVVLRVLLLLLLAGGLVLAWKRRSQPHYQWFLWFTLGLFISIPFVPPRDADIMRAYAVTVPTTILLPSIAMGMLARFVHNETMDSDIVGSTGRWAGVVGLSLALVTIFGSLAVQAASRMPSMHPLVCSDEQVPLLFRSSSGAAVHIVYNDSLSMSRLPFVLIKDVQDNLHDLPYSQFARVIRGIHEPKIILVAHDMISDSTVWIVGPPSLPGGGELVQACSEAFGTDLGGVFLVQSFVVGSK